MRAMVLLLALAVPSAWAQSHSTPAPPAHPPQITISPSTSSQAAAQSAQAFQQMQVREQNRRRAQCNAFKPRFSVEAGTYSSPVSVAITDVTPGAAIYYTLDGKKPSETSSLYTGPVTISATTKLRAIAVSKGGPSCIATAVYEMQ